MGDKTERRKSKWNVFLAILVVLFAAASISIYIAPQLLFNVYADEDDFYGRVDQRFRSMNILPDVGRRVITYDYSNSAATAIRYDASNNEAMAVFRDQRIKELQKDFKDRIKEEESSRKKQEGDDLLYRPLQHVLLIDTAVYDSGTGALTLAIYTEEYSENESNQTMEKTDTSIDTWLMAKDDMRSIKPIQAMAPGYREKAAVFAKEYLNTTYDESKLTGNEATFLQDKDGNFDKFVISADTVAFFFDPGTVVDEEEGVIAVNMQRNYMGATVRNRIVDRFVDPTKPMVALTYDDGPGGKTERQILKCLKKYNAVATFFYVGNRVSSDPTTVKMAYDMGCEIGNHSWDHSDLTTLSAEDITEQMDKTNNAVSKITGVKPTVFRPPYGAVNEEVMDNAGLPTILWDVDTLDWKLRDAEKVYKKLVKTDKLNGKIVLMHSIHEETADATEKIIPMLIKRGYQIVTVSEMIKYKTGESPKAGESY